MKLSFASLAALTAIAIVVGCATPQIGSVSKDEDTKEASGATTTGGNTPAVDSGAPATTAPLVPGTSACYATCLGTGTPAAKFESCRASCADLTCETACETTNCAGTDCKATTTSCAQTCAGTAVADAGTVPPTTTQARACTNACVAQTGAAQYWACTTASCNATPGDCDNDCFDDSICGLSKNNAFLCDSAVQACGQQCGDSLPDFTQ